MIKYMKNHEMYILENIQTVERLDELRDYHLRQIVWLQHERFIHLCVLCLTTIIFLACVIVLFFTSMFLANLLAVILGVLEMFYMIHYFRLENTVQRWYKIANRIDLLFNGIAVNVYD